MHEKRSEEVGRKIIPLLVELSEDEVVECICFSLMMVGLKKHPKGPGADEIAKAVARTLNSGFAIAEDMKHKMDGKK